MVAIHSDPIQIIGTQGKGALSVTSKAHQAIILFGGEKMIPTILIAMTYKFRPKLLDGFHISGIKQFGSFSYFQDGKAVCRSRDDEFKVN